MNHAAAAQWDAARLDADKAHWQFTLGDSGRRDLLASVKKAHDPDKTLLDYQRDEFDLGAARSVVEAAFAEAKRGRGIALVRGLPRAELDAPEFELLTWAIGLQMGVARPQGKASHYVSAVRDAGTAYRTGTGRGYSSNSGLDFHTDSADLVMLSCFNKAVSGGMSMATSMPAAHARMQAEFPELHPWLLRPIHFSRQGEQAADEEASYPQPIFDTAEGRLFGKWNRNRVIAAQQLAGVPGIPAEHQLALDTFDALVPRADLAYRMWLAPGDLQIMNSHVTLHSRTEFVDHADPAHKRLLFRVWIAPPDSLRLPQSWQALFKSIQPGSVRGGLIGQNHDERCRAFERRQAQALGMRFDAG